jgi:hypothetical protein
MITLLAPSLFVGFLVLWLCVRVSLPHSNNHLANNSADQGAEGLGVVHAHYGSDK